MKNLILYLFSFFLGFGLYDPFSTGGLYFDILTILAIVSIFLSNGIMICFRKLKIDTKLLLWITVFLFFSSVIYGVSFKNSIPINFKFLAAIIIFWLFSIEFSTDKKLAMKCILLFALSCGLLAFGYQFGIFNNQFQISNGRLIIFGENPNSISSRMAVSFIILFYVILYDPLKLQKWRFIGVTFLPSLVLFIIATGSRGSLLILILAVFLLSLFSNMKLVHKIILIFISLFISFLIFFAAKNTAIMDRFQNEGLTDSRDALWARAFSIFIKNPIFGVGEEGYLIEVSKTTSRLQDTHNLFLYFLVTGGLVVLLIFIIFLARQVIRTINELRYNKNGLPFIILFFFIILMAKTGGIITYLIMWYFLAFINSYPYKWKNIKSLL